jgi:hypothetical protein
VGTFRATVNFDADAATFRGSGRGTLTLFLAGGTYEGPFAGKTNGPVFSFHFQAHGTGAFGEMKIQGTATDEADPTNEVFVLTGRPARRGHSGDQEDFTLPQPRLRSNPPSARPLPGASLSPWFRSVSLGCDGPRMARKNREWDGQLYRPDGRLGSIAAGRRRRPSNNTSLRMASPGNEHRAWPSSSTAVIGGVGGVSHGLQIIR